MALTIEQFNAKYGIGGDKAPTAGGVQQPDITLRDVKTGALPRITRGIGAGLKQGASAAFKGIVTAADAIVPDRFQKLQSNVDARFDWLERQDQKIQDKLVRKLGVDGANMYITQASAAVGQGIGQLGSALVNPALGFTVIGSQALGAGKSAYDTAYSEALSLGKTPEQAKKIARINGYITGAVNMAEMIPVGRVVGLAKDVASKPASMATKKFISRFAKNALSEVGTEAGQDFVSSLTAKLTYDEDGEPLADALNSALVSIPTSLLFAGAGEVGNYQKVQQAKVDISAILESQGATKEEADTLADKMVEQRMIYDDGKDFEEMPVEIKESYDGAVNYLRWQNEQIATKPDFSIDQAKSDAAYQIIDAYDSYNQKANEQAIQQEEAVGEEMVSTTEKIVNFVKDRVNGDGALKKWREDSGKKFEALEKKIQEEKKKLEAQQKRDARNARARERRKEKKQEKLKSELEIQKQQLADLEKKKKRRERYNAIKQKRAEFLNEPYIPDDQLPVINAGSSPRDTSMPSLQVGADATGIPRQIPGYTYEPVDDYATMNDAMLKYMEEQNQLLEEVVTESETKATKENSTTTVDPKKWAGDSKIYEDADLFIKSNPTMYHGTQAEINSIQEIDPINYGDPEALYGPGVYMTDSAYVADGYSQTRGKNPSGGRILSTEIKKGTKLLNLDKKIPSDIVPLFNQIINQPYGDLEAGDIDVSEMTSAQAIKELQEVLSDAYIPKYEGAEVFFELQEALKEIGGYDGFMHRGGVDKNKEHNVVILFEYGDSKKKMPIKNLREVNTSEVDRERPSATLDEDIETARNKIAKIEAEIDSVFTDFTQDVTKEQLTEAREQFTEATGIPVAGEGVGFTGLKPIGGAGAKTSGLAASARIKEIEAGIVNEGTGFEDLPQTDRMSWAQQFPIVEELIKNDIELARDIAFGYKNPPEGVSGSIVYVKYLEKMMLENNIDEVDALKNSPMMDIATAVGQFSAGLGAIPSGENPVAIAKEIEKNRAESAQKKLPRGTDIKQVRKEIITSTKKKAEAETKKAIKEKEQWNAFLEEISC